MTGGTSSGGSLRRARGRLAGVLPRATAGPDGAVSLRTQSIRVALGAAVIVGAAYLVIAVAVAILVSNDLTAGVDRNLAAALGRITRGPTPDHDVGAPPPDRLGGSPILVWVVHSDGSVTSLTSLDYSAELPAEYDHVSEPRTVTISGISSSGGQIAGQLRVAGASAPDGVDYVVVGQSMDPVSQTQSTLIVAEVGIGLALVLFVFLGAIAIGRRVAEPIEQARQRQLEFTADASHELRTPLAVIEAQTSLALARERPEAWYRTAFQRVEGETRRMRRLVDDMLWLARFDATRGTPDAEPVDVNVLAAATVDRFRIVAEARHLALSLQGSGGTSIVTVPPEWLDRLLGVLLDNACKYSPEGGSVAVRVANEGRRVRLTVDDSGPGIPPADRERVFDRFHRATDRASGSGLGLAIADAVVRATNGRWTVGTSPAGGASFSVSWQRSMVGQGEGAGAAAPRGRSEATVGLPEPHGQG
ncbi:MAG TPA: HAMP domain-containing sensor histidine kinase [Candidatus Limnocylindrales bacterium]